MSATRLPALPPGKVLQADSMTSAQLLQDLSVGRMSGCTVHRVHESRVQVGILAMLAPLRGSLRWGIFAKRGGSIEWWEMDGSVWVNT